ncbi:MAG: OB-fold domain-containing protein [bacterium]
MSSDSFAIPPQPDPDVDSAGFWRATAEGHLAICRCRECQMWQQPPLERCKGCAGETEFVPVSGRGTVYSFIVSRHPCCPGYLDGVPYVIALIDLEEQEGLRLSARLVDVEPGEVSIGDPVLLDVTSLPGGNFQVPTFRIIDSI